MEVLSLFLIMQIFALLNPLASFPILMTAYRKKMNVKSIAAKAVVVGFIIAIMITFIGPLVFSIFGITLDSFRIAGGILLLLLGIEMVNPNNEKEEKIGKINSLITIIATPLLTGPATISFITIKAYEVGQFAVLMNLSIAFALVAAIFIMFSFTIKRINITAVDIFSRIMGLFVTAVSIEMIAQGITGILVL